MLVNLFVKFKRFPHLDNPFMDFVNFIGYTDEENN